MTSMPQSKPDELPPPFISLSPPRDGPSTNELPPMYAQNDPNHVGKGDIPSIRPLHFAPPGTPPTLQQNVTTDECIVHLKLLAAIADLRDSISTTDGLFNLHDRDFHFFPTEEERLKAATLTREKRWAIYVGRAVDRFTTWHGRCVQTDGVGSHYGALTVSDIVLPGVLRSAPDRANTIVWTADTLPPLDVLMVWHAYMLNPRDFLEDCLRMGKMSFWASGMPWEAVNFCINDRTLDYTPPPAAAEYFQRSTGLHWENMHDSPMKFLPCPNCPAQVVVPWADEDTTVGTLSHPFEDCTSFGDKNFRASCAKCGQTVTHDKLRVAKFRNDVLRLLSNGTPMPGTILNINGMPESRGSEAYGFLFPNGLITRALSSEILGVLDFAQNPSASIAGVRDFLQNKLQNFAKVYHGLKPSELAIPKREERLAIRKMMSRYWDNSSPFALDLVGAVIRQGTFIQKMDNIDWIHSPALESTMNRLLAKYAVFFNIICANPGRMAVPTLDVDLAWHTHQLSPRFYFFYSTHHAVGRFIDHDDKVAEAKLSDAFEWTSKQYQRLTHGKIYSECNCWYCEAIRESHNNSSLFKSSATTQAQKSADLLHDSPEINPDPEKNPHISAHNAVRTQNPLGPPAARIKATRLQVLHQKAIRRMSKRSVRAGGEKGKGNNNDVYAGAPMVWGFPIMMPMYMPYGVDPCIHTELYAGNPSCVNMLMGGVGNCVAGTCGAGVAAGSCWGGGDTSGGGGWGGAACTGGVSFGGSCGASGGGSGGGC
ncbi:hypothetical protein FQN53_003115 [Emmonsiellopsis sp. PD_33]|nr:hypothetical protein FQN53_003115 [Emmonsiellopsis sp. PD_33]